MDDTLRAVARGALTDIAAFSRGIVGRPLRGYQLAVARAILDSVLNRRGLSFAVMMSRQAGKNETSAQLEAFLLLRFMRRGGTLIKAAPTYEPQLAISRLRLESALNNPWTARLWRRQGNAIRLGAARCAFLSARPGANVVGATADILLECDEAQDVDADKWDRDFAPMGASSNVTTVFWGTAWTSATLLARQIRDLERLEQADGIRRVFRVAWPQVAAELPAYGHYVAREMARLGADHPLIQTQYALREADSLAGLFPPTRRQHMRGDHPRLSAPRPGHRYVLCLDVGGEQTETLQATSLQADTDHDHTALTVFELDESSADLRGPVYRVVDRRLWVGVPQTALYGAVLDLAREVWHANRLVIDATGLGAGLASFLRRALGDQVVLPLVFTAGRKSELGWAFLALCDTGRFKDHAPDGSAEQTLFWRQVEAAQGEIVAGPGRRLRWEVPDPRLHDDLLVSAALIAALDDARPYRPSLLVEAGDALADIDRARF